MPKSTKPKTKPPAPTADTYSAMQTAYDHFNRELFASTLPACLITLQRQRGAHGYFSGGRFHARGGQGKADEIAMNPNHIGGRTVTQTLSTLAHEMAHLWQHHFGKPSRNGYHNQEWAQKMHNIGLAPTSTGVPGGKETGQKVTHVSVAGGLFARSCDRLLKTGLRLTWHDLHAGDPETTRKKSNTRSKYTCPDCGLNAWAKPGAPLLCGDCEVSMDEELPTASADAQQVA